MVTSTSEIPQSLGALVFPLIPGVPEEAPLAIGGPQEERLTSPHGERWSRRAIFDKSYLCGYTALLYQIRQTEVFTTWLKRLRDQKGRARILARLESARLGNLGDTHPVGEGVSEMRIHFGPGYRVYFVRQQKTVLLLLCGGDKSTQAKDIRRAKKLAREPEE